jgi:tetratricopeptide (TPR) repeat protein/GAF domain-containing protein
MSDHQQQQQPELERISRVGRSVLDYKTNNDLRQALQESCEDWKQDLDINTPTTSNLHLSASHTNTNCNTNIHHDQSSSCSISRSYQEQTVEHELQRLLALQSYSLLDSTTADAEIQQLLNQVRHTFKISTAMICLVDMGRIVVYASSSSDDSTNGSTNGSTLPILRETPRVDSFCSHALLQNNTIMLVSDAHSDPRFTKFNNNNSDNDNTVRFYAGASLQSTDGYKIGTLCVQDYKPHDGSASFDRTQLQTFATQVMTLLRRHTHDWRRHAAVTTNLGGLLYPLNECYCSMRLYQESVQTLLDQARPSRARQQEASDIYHAFVAAQQQATTTTDRNSRDDAKQRQQALLQKGRAFAMAATTTTTTSNEDNIMNNNNLPNDENACRLCGMDGVPGLFGTTSRLRGSAQQRRHQAGLVFSEAFQIAMEETENRVDYRNFIIPLDHCSKATLFNMGLIHYHWGSPDIAMQFFDLAASLSQANTPLEFDPVVLGCLNNMAQIHLQYGRPQDAMDMLSDALTRGNAALARLYTHDDRAEAPFQTPETRRADDVKTNRLRRKLARTVMNMGHVHFFSCDFDASMATCLDATRLLHTTSMEDTEATAAWYNMGVLHHHKGERMEALKYLQRFCLQARSLVGTKHQVADALHRQGQIMYESGNLYESMKPLNEALRIRKEVYGNWHITVSESLCLIGKVLQAREEYDFALEALQEGLVILRRQAQDGELPLDAAQILLEVGRVLHMQGEMEKSLLVYTEAAGLTKKFFGERHAFVARILNIIGNLRLEIGDSKAAVTIFADAMKIHVELGIPFDANVVQDRLLKVKMLPKHAGCA